MITCVVCGTPILEDVDGPSRVTKKTTESSSLHIASHDSSHIIDKGVVYCGDSCAPREFRSDPPDKTALEALVDFFYDENTDESIEYYKNRGWDQKLIKERKLGWAPPDSEKAYNTLKQQGYSNAEILSTGAFSMKGGTPFNCLWRGRYIIPYFNREGHVEYAIARSTGSEGGGAVGYDGHPQDIMPGKYAKLAINKPFTTASEPIYGLQSLDDYPEDYVIITEGAPDAISCIYNNMPVLSPVTTNFTAEQYDVVIDILQDHQPKSIYIVPDNEPIQDDREREISVGLQGGLEVASELRVRDLHEDITLSVVLPPRNSVEEKVDLDDYLQTHSKSDFEQLADNSLSPEQFKSYDKIYEKIQSRREATKQDFSNSSSGGDGSQSDLFNLTLPQVLPNDFSSKGDRGENPIQHTGNSRTYFLLDTYKGSLIAHDFKRDTTYTPLTYILCVAGERSVDDPNGPMSDKEMWVAWKWAKEQNLLPDTDPIPSRAIKYIAREKLGHIPEDKNEMLPYDIYRDTLELIESDYGLQTGRL